MGVGEQANFPDPLPAEILVRQGDATLEAWRAYYHMGVAIGAVIVDFETPQATPEQESTPRYATLADFHAIAKANNRLQGLATRAWNILQRTFYLAHNNDTEPPIFFARHPTKERNWLYREVIDDLDIASLARTIIRLQGLITPTEKRTYDCIHDVFGRNISIGMFEFLELVVASWPPPSEESTTK